MASKSITLALVLLSALLLSRWLRRFAFPKDYAYAVSERFGPTLRLPIHTRIRRKLPWVQRATIDLWLPDFALVNDEVWRLARLGGTSKLGNREVEARLRAKFPFLRFEGLSQAVFLASYFAWHEGYDKAPEPDGSHRT